MFTESALSKQNELLANDDNSFVSPLIYLDLINLFFRKFMVTWTTRAWKVSINCKCQTFPDYSSSSVQIFCFLYLKASLSTNTIWRCHHGWPTAYLCNDFVHFNHHWRWYHCVVRISFQTHERSNHCHCFFCPTVTLSACGSLEKLIFEPWLFCCQADSRHPSSWATAVKQCRSWKNK